MSNVSDLKHFDLQQRKMCQLKQGHLGQLQGSRVKKKSLGFGEERSQRPMRAAGLLIARWR